MDLQSTTELARQAGNVALVGAALYPLATFLVNSTSMLLSRKIGSQEELETIVRDEQTALGLQNVPIKAELVKETKGRYAGKDGSYKITIGGLCANASTVRHELYHILKREKGKPNNCFVDFEQKNPLKTLGQFVHYWYSGEEASCLLYEAFRVKV